VDQKPGLRSSQNIFVFLTAALIAPGISTPTAYAAKAMWSYSGSTGPEHWASENEAYALCAHGKSQSPVDIEKTTKQDLPRLGFDYEPTALRVTDTGRSIQVNYQPGSALTVGGERYALVQFHFHKPSEEKLHGRAYSMVVHLVHRNDRGELAVVAVLLRSGKTNAFLEPIFDNFPAPGITESADAGQTLNAAELLPANQGYFSFEGSLTMPPCSEHVRWFVLKTPVEISTSQIQKFAAHYPKNARPVQPLNGRVILESKN
jgi:carbonic anhydrase